MRKLLLILLLFPVLNYAAFPVDEVSLIIIEPETPNNWLATLSMVLGILALPMFILSLFVFIVADSIPGIFFIALLSSIILSFASFITGLISVKRGERRWQSIVGMVLGIPAIISFFLFLLFVETD